MGIMISIDVNINIVVVLIQIRICFETSLFLEQLLLSCGVLGGIRSLVLLSSILIKLILVLSLNLILVLIVKPLVTPCILDPKEAVLDHDEEDILNDTIENR